MLKKHLTFLFLLAMAVSTFAQSIPSGTGRFEALGYNPFILDAATDINRNPAWSTWYRNYAFGDIGRQVSGEENQTGDVTSNEFWLGESYAGVNFGLTKQINLGAVLNRQEGQIWSGSFRSQYQSLALSAPIVPTELLFGWMTANKKFSVGVAPYYARWSSDYTSTSNAGDTTIDGSTSIIGGTVGVVGKFKDGLWEVNADVRSNKYKYDFSWVDKDTNGGNTSRTELQENNGGIEINAVARAFFMVSKPNKLNVVPYVAFGMFNWDNSITTTPTATTTPQPENKWLSIRGGVGINMPVLDDGLLAGGLSFGMTTTELNGEFNPGLTDTTITDTKVTSINFPMFNVGGEWKFTDWLTGRIGYARGVIRSTQKQTRTTTSLTNNTTQISTVEANVDSDTPYEQTITLGLGWHFGRFSLDGLVGERFVQRGPNILSGKKNDLFGVVSTSYNFNK